MGRKFTRLNHPAGQQSSYKHTRPSTILYVMSPQQWPSNQDCFLAVRRAIFLVGFRETLEAETRTGVECLNVILASKANLVSSISNLSYVYCDTYRELDYKITFIGNGHQTAPVRIRWKASCLKCAELLGQYCEACKPKSWVKFTNCYVWLNSGVGWIKSSARTTIHEEHKQYRKIRSGKYWRQGDLLFFKNYTN